MARPHHLPAVERQLFGGCVGSTCGGIKALRFLIMFKQSIQEMNQLAHPRAAEH
jgi:Trk-type K+ transport system membrane component